MLRSNSVFLFRLANIIEARYSREEKLVRLRFGSYFARGSIMTALATPSPRKTPPTRRRNESAKLAGEVLTLAEAAAYLRVSEDEIIQLTKQRGLPGRQAGQDWRFLKTALQDWLKRPELVTDNTPFLELAGKFHDDPFLKEIVTDVYRQRGRPIVESAKRFCSTRTRCRC
jgi:excisionase family DNA binding protein